MKMRHHREWIKYIYIFLRVIVRNIMGLFLLLRLEVLGFSDSWYSMSRSRCINFFFLFITSFISYYIIFLISLLWGVSFRDQDRDILLNWLFQWCYGFIIFFLLWKSIWFPNSGIVSFFPSYIILYYLIFCFLACFMSIILGFSIVKRSQTKIIIWRVISKCISGDWKYST